MEEEPLILRATHLHTLRISNLALAAPSTAAGPTRHGGAFYEITIAGPAVEPGGAVRVHVGKYVVVPIMMPQGGEATAAQLSVTPLEERHLRWRDPAPTGQRARAPAPAQASFPGSVFEVELEVDKDGGLHLLSRELVVEIRRVGHACTPARVQLV